MKKIAVTGGSGQIAYSLLFRLAAGELFGQEPISLHIVDLPACQQQLEGVAMELEDGAFKCLEEISIGSDSRQAYENADAVFLVGAKPRGPGMERADLLQENGQIFIQEGKALNEAASQHVKVLVVGNPCNTNCLIAMHHAPNLPRSAFHAMMRLDQNRASSCLAKKLQRPVREIEGVVIWGNHSLTQLPDASNVTIEGKKLSEHLGGTSWLHEEFVSFVQKRGAGVIAKRGKSSAASAANAALDAMKDLVTPTGKGRFYTSAMCTDENPYGLEENLIFGLPCRTEADGQVKIVPGLEWDYFVREGISVTQKELVDERLSIQGVLA